MEESNILTLMEHWDTVCKIHKIMANWEDKGLHSKLVSRKNKDDVEEVGWLPLHPEFMFRDKGEWKGWSKFCKTPESDTDSRKHHTQMDQLEEVAWRIVQKLRAEKANKKTVPEWSEFEENPP